MHRNASPISHLFGGTLVGLGEQEIQVVGFEVRIGVQVVELLPEVFLEEEFHPRPEIVELVLVISLDVETKSELVVEQALLHLVAKNKRIRLQIHIKASLHG